MTLLELAEHCEQAAALQDDGGYKLNGDIAKAIGWTYRLREATHSWGWCRPGNDTHFDAQPPAFATSLDAAMTLVQEPEKGVSVWRSPRDGGLCCATVHHGLVTEAQTMPLALCAAALRARAASVDRSPEGGDRETGRHAKHESAVAKPDAHPSAPSLQTPQGGDS